ncbi:MAG: MBL fold metallo-hydrolase [Rhizobiaceae bacterium]
MKLSYCTLVRGNNLKLDTGYLGISSVVLIQVNSRNILFDTGGYATRAAVRRGLAQLGLEPKDVSIIVLSHAHFDHCQNLNMFPNAKIMLSSAEFDYLQNPAEDDDGIPFGLAGYLKEKDLEIFDGEFDLYPDVSLFPTPGHTPGHYSMRLILPSKGTVILAGDAIKYPREAIQKKSDLAFDSAKNANKSILKILRQADFVVPGHFSEFSVQGEKISWEDDIFMGLHIR